MTGPGGWGVLEEITTTAAPGRSWWPMRATGTNTAFQARLDTRGWQYAVAVKGTTSAYAGDAQPVTRTLGGRPGRPPRPGFPAQPVNLRHSRSPARTRSGR